MPGRHGNGPGPAAAIGAEALATSIAIRMIRRTVFVILLSSFKVFIRGTPPSAAYGEVWAACREDRALPLPVTQFYGNFRIRPSWRAFQRTPRPTATAVKALWNFVQEGTQANKRRRSRASALHHSVQGFILFRLPAAVRRRKCRLPSCFHDCRNMVKHFLISVSNWRPGAGCGPRHPAASALGRVQACR